MSRLCKQIDNSSKNPLVREGEALRFSRSIFLIFVAGTHCGGSRGDRPRLEPECKQHSQGRQHHSSSARQVSWPPNRVYNGRNGSCSLLRCVLPISLFALLLFWSPGRLTLSWKRSCNAWRLKSEQLWIPRLGDSDTTGSCVTPLCRG